MKAYKTFILSSMVAVAAFVAFAFINPKPSSPTTKNSAAGESFAVVELYTSEGCSSCPPADELFAKIAKENNNRIFLLAFHVDYWNRLGWKDVFSDAGYSSRQGDYARYLKTSSVYTPQIVVNGRKEFVGSQEGTLRNAIKSALLKDAQIKITISNIKASGKQATLNYELDGNINNTSLLFALVERSAKTAVRAGENSGRTLSHVQIVRNLQAVAANKGKAGVASVTLPNGFTVQNFEIIGLLQNTVTGEIMGATRAEFITPAI